VNSNEYRLAVTDGAPGENVSNASPRANPWVEGLSLVARQLQHPFETIHLGIKYAVTMVRLASMRPGPASQATRPAAAPILQCFPSFPLPFYTVWGMARVGGIQLSRKEGSRGLVFCDRTVLPPSAIGSADWINGRCVDIRKTVIARVFEQVSGQTLLVNAVEYRGPMVEKSETNGTHNGRVVQGPLQQVRPNVSYQRLIDNRMDGGQQVEDLRTVIVGGSPVLVYRKRRTAARRFESGAISASIAETREVYSAAEVSLLSRFCQRLGLDFGEIDILRDNHDQRIYCVDVNTTPALPPISLPYSEMQRALGLIATQFRNRYF